MESTNARRANVIALEHQHFRAVRCEICGAKMFPKSLLEPHLSNHRRHQRWLNGELRKLQETFSRMREIA
jgi:uncharacterized OB-fold protein